MKEGHPEHHFSDGFTKESLLNVSIAASVLIAFGATTYCLSTGIFIVFSHLFYIPIVLAAYRYPERGVAFAGALAAGYFAEVLYFSPGDGVEIANALLRIAMFFVVAVVVSNLSGRLQARESRYRGIFETSGAGIFLFSPKTGKIAEMNRECSAMLGYPDDDVPSLEVPAIWPGYPGLAGALEEGRIEGLDCSLAGRDGTSCPVLLSAGLLPGRQEGCVVVTGTAELKRMESRLRRSEETLRVILDTTDVGFLLTDSGREVVEANAAAIRLFGGAGREDLVGRNPYDLVAGRDREVVRAYREQALSGEAPASGECTLCRLDGTEWPAEITITRFAQDGAAPGRLVVSLRDVTERHRAEEAIREENMRLSVVNEVVAAAAAAHGLEDLCRVSLAKILTLLGFDHGAVYLMRPRDDAAVLRAQEGVGEVLPPVVRREDPLYQEILQAGAMQCIEDFSTRYPGSRVRVLAVVPIPGDDGPAGWIGVGSRVRGTITRSERAVLLAIGNELGNAVVKGMLQEDLEAALASANRYLEEANAAAAEANLYMDILTHDINNANTIAMGYLQMHLESAAESDGALVGKSLAAVYQSSEIIRNVLTLRRLKAGPAELRPVRLEPVIRGICSYHADARIACTGADATVLADDLVSEVFANLIGNAIKFGGPAVEIAIGVREEEDTVSVTVADTGPGIPDDLKPRLFERNHRGTTKKSGKGLGLYIVRMLVERYGGSVRAGDRIPGRPGGGAAVTFTLPRCRKATE
ncbi:MULTISPECIES: PAS domain-containing sensor histidine kinase [unclassified Methanoculleus]|uniref:PAS domain-containing sensor histidine kinase n=1 Tax=unclassified Methanoculleus TaxID=2619537 RepID=UPI0025F1A176|nr:MULTISPECIES: PAS domain S-box protein [unclassified Methanoculleus]